MKKNYAIKMDVQQIIDAKKNLQRSFIDYLEGNDDEENQMNLMDLLIDQQIYKNYDDLKIFLRMINKISKNHCRNPQFFSKIEKIILYFKDEIQNFFTNDEIIQIFRQNRRILLFLIEEKIITLNEKNIETLKKYKNFENYFAPELSSDHNSFNAEKYFETFNEKRHVGENDDYICKLIRDDNIDEFISFIKLNNINLSTTIKSSIYETNSFLIDKNPTLIEYSSFFGSIQIFRYLYQNKVVLTSSLWLYSMHGQSQEIINILNENMIISQDKQLYDIVNESIKCHHIEVTNYICNNLFDENMPNILNDKKFGNESIKHYNFIFFPRNQSLKNYLYYFCRYGYTSIVKLLLRDQSVNVNQIEPIIEIFLLIFFLMKHHSFLLLKIET